MAGPILQMNARERRLVAVLGFVAALVGLFAIPFGLEAIVRSQASDNDDLRQALQDVQDARGVVHERQARKDAIAARYSRKAPELAGFIEQQARAQKLEVTDSTPMPDVPHGKRYVEHGTNVRLKKTGMLPLARFLESVERSGYPVAVTRLNIRRRSAELDSYDVEVGLSSYDRSTQPETPAPTGSAGSGGKP
jgi:general secretion pathway protein M